MARLADSVSDKHDLNSVRISAKMSPAWLEGNSFDLLPTMIKSKSDIPLALE